jgi:hypothetical protein
MRSNGRLTIHQHQIDKLVAIGFQFNLRLDRPTLQRTNLPDMPNLPDMQDMPALPLPDCIPPVTNVIAD